MPATVVVGLQWGDEGKGKIIDFLADRADVVVRFQGGANAGHTVQVGEALYAFHLLPSGVLRKRTMNLIGNGVVVEPGQLLKEIDETRARGHPVKNLRISDRAHVVMPYHKIIDGLEERLKGNLGAGTTLRGIGPAFEDKVGRFGIRMCDLIDRDVLRAKFEKIVPIKQRLIEAYGGTEPLDVDALFAEHEAYGKRLEPFVIDTSAWLDAALRRRKRVLFEGAQGTHLCIDHGIYPFGTSSDCVAGAAAVGAGVGPQYLTDVVGVAKSFTSRVGAGPFPTELEGPVAEHLRERGGGEYGTTTRRPRRVGWLDLVMLRMAVRVNGLTGIALTKLDVLAGLDKVRVGVGYRFNERILKDFPASMRVLSQCGPVYREFRGWPDLPEAEWIGIAEKGKRALPEAARKYIGFVESQLKVPVRILSVGRSRAATIGHSRT
ncbi:MAG: adenylosuccinate synthase [Thermoplasmata archaeon]